MKIVLLMIAALSLLVGPARATSNAGDCCGGCCCKAGASCCPSAGE